MHLPDTLTAIGDAAFKGCVALRSVRLPCKLERIGRRAFQGCAALRLWHIPSAAVGEQAFEGCTSIVAVRIGALPTAHATPGRITNAAQPLAAQHRRRTAPREGDGAAVAVAVAVAVVAAGALKGCTGLARLLVDDGVLDGAWADDGGVPGLDAGLGSPRPASAPADTTVGRLQGSTAADRPRLFAARLLGHAHCRTATATATAARVTVTRLSAVPLPRRFFWHATVHEWCSPPCRTS